MFRCTIALLTLITVAATAGAEDKAKKPLGTWVREAGENKVTFAIKADKITSSIKMQNGDLVVESTYEVTKEGDDIVGKLETNFKVPFQDGKDGTFKAWFGGPKKWAIEIEADLKVPGFKKGHIGGSADGSGDFQVHGELEGDGSKFIQAASVRFGYKKGGWFFGGSVTLEGSVKPTLLSAPAARNWPGLMPGTLAGDLASTAVTQSPSSLSSDRPMFSGCG